MAAFFETKENLKTMIIEYREIKRDETDSAFVFMEEIAEMKRVQTQSKPKRFAWIKKMLDIHIKRV